MAEAFLCGQQVYQLHSDTGVEFAMIEVSGGEWLPDPELSLKNLQRGAQLIRGVRSTNHGPHGRRDAQGVGPIVVRFDTDGGRNCR
jgi:hypothetical protein